MKFTSEDLLKAMGLKVGQKVLIPAYNNTELIVTKDCLKNEFCSDLSIAVLVDEDFTIIQPKPTLTEDEKVILRNLPKEYKYIVRDDKMLIITTRKPLKRDILENFGQAFILPYYNLFQFIKWEDEPYSIEELLKEN